MPISRRLSNFRQTPNYVRNLDTDMVANLEFSLLSFKFNMNELQKMTRIKIELYNFRSDARLNAAFIGRQLRIICIIKQ